MEHNINRYRHDGFSTAIPADVEPSLRALQYREPLVFRSRMTREQFYDFVLKNSELKIERDKHGTITIHPPMTFDSGYYEGEGFFALKQWSKTDRLSRLKKKMTEGWIANGVRLAWLIAPLRSPAGLPRFRRMFPPQYPA